MSSSDSPSDSSLLFLFLLSLVLSCRGSTTCTGSYSSTCWHRCQLFTSCSHDFFDVFALQFTNDFLNAFSISINAYTAEDVFDVLVTGACIASQNSKQVCGHVTHSGILSLK